MGGREYKRPIREVLPTAKFEVEDQDRTLQSENAADPQSNCPEHSPPGCRQQGNKSDQQEDRPAETAKIEDDRPEIAHRAACPAKPTHATRYL